MAKRRPSYTLAQMEGMLGYKVEFLNDPHNGLERFYSDLSPVPKDTYKLTGRELGERRRGTNIEVEGFVSNQPVLELGVAHVSTPVVNHLMPSLALLNL